MEQYIKKGMVSIIVPAYNAEEYIEECITSIISQPYPNIEVIVINDGSSDSTPQIIQTLVDKDPRIKLISTDNFGVCSARNIGIKHAIGEYIMFVDADDALLNNVLPYLIDLQKEYCADIISATALSVPQKKEYDAHLIPATERTVLKNLEPLKHSLLDLPATYSVWAKLYTRDLIENISFPYGKRIHEDSFFLFKCFLKKPTMLITNAVVYKYTLTPDSASRSTFTDKFFDMLDLLEIKLQDTKEQYPEFEELSYNMIVKTHLALLVNLCKSTDKKTKKAEKESIRQVIQYKRFFHPVSSFDKTFFFIVRNHLYGLYKFAHQVKESLNRSIKR